MQNGIFKRVLGTAVAAFLAITSAPLVAKPTTADAAKTLTTSPGHTQETDWYHDYHHEIWQADTPNSSTMTLADEGGGFSTKWQCGPNGSRGNFLARRGLFYGRHTGKHWQDYGNFTCQFDCEWSAGSSGNSRICIYGWTEDPLVEFYIIEDWKNWVPSAGGQTQRMGTANIDGSEYEILKNPMNSYNITNTNGPFTQYISVRKNRRTSGTISIYKHFQEWEKLGMKMGDFYEVAFNVEGWESDGQANVKKNIITYGEPVTEEPTEPPTAPEPDQNGNYIAENFESGKGNFQGRGGASVSVDNKNYYDGNSSLKVTGRTQNWHGGAIPLSSSTFVPGETYSISCAALQKSGSTKDLKLTLEYTAGDQDWKEVASVDAESGVWTKLENKEFTIPSGASDMTLYLESSDEDLEFYIDSVQLAKAGKASSVVTGGGTVEGAITTQAPTEAPTTTTTTTTQAPTEAPTTGIQPTKWGDANCDNNVNIADAVLVMQASTNPDKYGVGKSSSGITEQGAVNADVDGYKGLTNNDALLIQKFKLGLISEFPVESQKKNELTTTAPVTQTTKAITTETPIVTDAPANYFKSSFNSGADSWQGRGDASVAVNKDNYINGSSLKVTGRTDSWNGAEIKLDNSFVAGGTYSISAGVLQKVSESDDFKISLEYTKSDGEKDYDTVAEGKASKNTWTKLENTAYTVPEGASNLILYVETAKTTIDFFIDEIAVQAKGTSSSITTGSGTVSNDPEPEIGKVDPSKPMIAISFDDGCSPANNKKIVDALTEQGFHATFFYVSDWSQGAQNQAEIKYAYSKGMEIANHTVSHPYLGQKSAAEIRQEADGCHNYLKSVIGAEPSKLLRLPYLDQGGAVKSTLTDYGLVTDAIDTQDYMDNVTKDQIVQTIKNAMANGSGNGAVVLCHETKDKTAQAMVELAPYIKAQGWQIVTISEMFAAKGKAIPYGQIITRV